MQIALLEDDSKLRSLILEVLAHAGLACHSFPSSKELLAQMARDGCEMLIIDWQSADRGAAEVLSWVRSQLGPAMPVLFITARSAEEDIVAALAAGANDYIVKPVRRGELLTRVQTLLKRAYPTQSAQECLRFGHYAFEPRTGRLAVDGKPVDLTQKEFELALLFFRNLGRPLSRAYILDSIWPHNSDVPSRTMDTHVSRVRSKLRLRPEHGFRLAPVYSYGYQLEQLR